MMSTCLLLFTKVNNFEDHIFTVPSCDTVQYYLANDITYSTYYRAMILILCLHVNLYIIFLVSDQLIILYIYFPHAGSVCNISPGHRPG